MIVLGFGVALITALTLAAMSLLQNIECRGRASLIRVF